MDQQKLLSTEEKCELVVSSYRERKKLGRTGTLHGLCLHHHVRYAVFTKWLKQQGKTCSDLMYEVQEEVSNQYRPDEESFDVSDYETVLSIYKKWLLHDPHLPLKRFCNDRSVDYKALHQWMRRRNITISELKVRAGVSLEEKQLQGMRPPLFGRVLNGYKQKLSEDPQYSFRQYCRDCRADYEAMMKWLAHIGIQIKQLKAAVSIEQRVPRQRSVFVQFKPNGGSNGDRLTGVKIQLSDGSNIQVEECTVISLCAFINQYNNDQKRH